MKRYHPPNVLPLEVWDVLVDGGPLYLLPASQLQDGIASVIAQLRQGTAKRLRQGLALPRLRIERVVLGGGGATPELARALGATLHEDPVWIGEAGGRVLHADAVWEIGQTSVKYSDREGRVRLPRPLDRVPIESDARHLPRAELRARTLAFLVEATQNRATPESLVLAMPCEIDDECRVAGCSYPWTDGDAHLISDLLDSAGLRGVPTLVLNDAELAAVAVQGAGTLVLTLGLGLGGAYLTQPA